MTLSTRASAAWLLVVISLALATLACYSGQVPGVFELTPFHTPTPFPTPAASRLSVGEYAYVPQEAGRPFFHLSVYPEPVAPNLLNSRAMCNGNSSARVLYAAEDPAATIYYLIDCGGSVGWAAEGRLAGPLLFERNDLALALAPAGEPKVTMLDELTLQPAPAFLQQCPSETIVPVLDLKAADQDGDGTREVYYQIECPRGTRGYVEGSQLLGPLEIAVGDRALAVIGASDDGETYRLAREPGPVTDANAVEAACAEGDILTAEEARVVDQQVYYRVTCGAISGWASSDRFIGPFRYDIGQNVLIQVEPIASLTTAPEPTPGEAQAAGSAALAAPEVVYTVPPAFLTSSAGPANFGTEDVETNIVGVCPDGAVASISDYVATDGRIYDEVTCLGCLVDQLQTEERAVTIGGASSAATVSICPETRALTGWVEQASLRGPLPFVPGDRVRVKAGSAALQTTDDGLTFVRLPTTTSGAFALTPTSQHIEFAGRCPADAPLTVVDFAAEQARTGAALTFYFQVECAGQPSSAGQFDENASETITGWVLARDLERAGP